MKISDSDEEQIEVAFEPNMDSAMKKQVEQLKLEEAYSNNSDIVEELIHKRRTYDKYKMKEIIEDLHLFHSEEEIYRYLYGNYPHEQDYNKRPLAKLTHDILEELGVSLNNNTV